MNGSQNQLILKISYQHIGVLGKEKKTKQKIELQHCQQFWLGSSFHSIFILFCLIFFLCKNSSFSQNKVSQFCLLTLQFTSQPGGTLNITHCSFETIFLLLTETAKI